MNTDQTLVAKFLNGDRAPAAIDSNPLAKLLGGLLVEADAAGTVTLSFEPPATFTQGAGVLQGGTVATLLDFGLAFSLLAALPAEKTFGTASLNVNLMKPAAPGKYLVRGKVDRLGSLVAFGSAELVRA